MPFLSAAMDLARAFPGATSAQLFPSCKVSNAQDQATSQGAAVHLKLRWSLSWGWFMDIIWCLQCSKKTMKYDVYDVLLRNIYIIFYDCA